jgi:hypothetical protein
MTEAVPQQHLDWKALWRWSVPLGITLGLLFAMDFYFGLVLANAWVWMYEVLAYFLLSALLFFLVGLRRGRQTGGRDDGVRVMLLASGLQVPTTLILIGIFSWVFHFWYMDHFGVLFALFGFDLEGGGLGVAWWLVQALVFQIPLGMVAARIGAAVGRHSSGKPSEPDEAAEP